jgi:hypothetical protein
MCLRRSSGILVFFVIALAGSPSPARAWTRALVEGARATVDVEADATLAVSLRLDIDVQAGWLHEIELAGLGAGVELDRRRPPYFRSEEGEIFRPEAEVREDGLVHLSFPRREAPRRGAYRVFMRYRVKADVRSVEAKGAPRARVVWSMPAWETGLHNASVEMRAPRGSSVPTSMHDAPPGVEFRVVEHPERTVVEWHRIHVPRLTPWQLSLDVPADAIALPSTDEAEHDRTGFRPLTSPTERSVAWPLLIFAALALLKRRSLEITAGRSSLLARAPWAAVLAVTALSLSLGQWLAPHTLFSALPLIAMSLHRPARHEVFAYPQGWSPVPESALRAKGMRTSDFLDATSVPGLVVLAASSVSLIALGEPASALLLLPIFLTGTKHHGFATSNQSAAVLHRFARALRLPHDAPQMSFNWERSHEERPRLRIHFPVHRAGLVTLSFVVTSSALGFVRHRKVMLFVETRAQSDADDLVRRRTNKETVLRASDGTMGRLTDWNAEAIALLRALAQEAPKPVKASRGTWLLREISEPRCQAA